MWERLTARWRRYQQRREEGKLLAWKEAWRPEVWAAFVPLKYHFTPHAAVKRHVAALIMPSYQSVFYRPNLTMHERRLAGAMALAALQRGTPSKPYVIYTNDLRFPDGPEDNQHWVDWLVALEYLAPMAYVDHLVTRRPDKAELYLTCIFDLDPAAAKHRLIEHRMWKACPKNELFQPYPVRLHE